jgi:hypothetical protein
MKIIVLYIVLAFQAYSQQTPLGKLEIVKKSNPVKSGVISFNGNLFLIPYNLTNFIQKYTGSNFVNHKKLNMPFQSNSATTKTIYSFNNFIIIVSGENTVSYSKDGDTWTSVLLKDNIASISGADFFGDTAYFVGKSIDSKQIIVKKTRDFVFFDSVSIKTFKDENIANFTVKFSIINGKFYFSYPGQRQRNIVTEDFKTFEYSESIVASADYYKYFNYIVMTPGWGPTSVIDSNLNEVKSMDIYFQPGSNLTTDDIGFGLSMNNYSGNQIDGVHYTKDGLNWATFAIPQIEQMNFGTRQIDIFNNYLFVSGDGENVYKIGPIKSSKPLSVESELIHAVKITGNIGQQVEILASDDLNGEYKPLTYFTLPSTEFIYNDNRNSKSKQYYKVR